MKERLFRWYTGEHPFYAMPTGWGWLKPRCWRIAKQVTLVASWDYEHGGGSQAIQQAIRQAALYGTGALRYPWDNERMH